MTTKRNRVVRVLALVCVLLLPGAAAASAQSVSAASAKPVKLSSSYTGTVTNLTVGGTSTLTLTGVKQTRIAKTSTATVTGTLKVGSGSLIGQTSKFFGYEHGKTLTLTIPAWKEGNCLEGGCKIVYLATIGSHGKLTGFYSYFNGVGGTQSGIWAVDAA